MSERFRPTMDLIGAGLGLTFVVWIGAVSALTGGRPGPMAALVLGFVAAIVVARRVAVAHPLVVPALVAMSPILALLVHRSSLLGPGPLEYANSSGALYFVAACAAVSAGWSTRGIATRGAWYLLAIIWILVPWKVGADAAGVLTLLLPIAVLAIRRPGRVRAILLAGGALAVAGLVFTAIIGGSDYDPGARVTEVDQWFDSNLGDLRVELWGESLELVRGNPATGIGPGMFRETSATALARGDARWAHNEYLQVAAETGIPGGVLLLALVAWGFACLWPPARELRALPAVVALAGVCLHANIDFIWHFPEVPLALGLLVGAASSRGGRADDPEDVPIQPTSMRARVILASTLALWLFLLVPNPAINPPSTVINAVAWAPDRPGLILARPGIVHSTAPPRALYDRVVAARALSIEAWAASHSADQEGPARIVSASDGISQRNFTLGQEGERLVFRLRTTETSENGNDPQLEVEDVFVTRALQHLVVVTDADQTRLYVDGTLRWSGDGPGGTLANWDPGYPLLLGNESSGDRPWAGEVRFLALYDRVLTGEEVEQAFASRPPGAGATNNPEIHSSALAAYSFREGEGAFVADRSGHGAELNIPSRIAWPAPGLAAILTDAGGDPALRFVLHAALFALWGGLLLVLADAERRFTRRDAALLILAGGSVAMILATTIRYFEARAPSWWDLAGAGAGLLVGLVMAFVRSESAGRASSETAN